eukprot:272897-Chlamydomonas_euryale.AAC.1
MSRFKAPAPVRLCSLVSSPANQHTITPLTSASAPPAPCQTPPAAPAPPRSATAAPRRAPAPARPASAPPPSAWPAVGRDETRRIDDGRAVAAHTTRA